MNFKMLVIVSSFISVKVSAEIIKIPTTSGFSGFVTAGAGLLDYKSNMFIGPNKENDKLRSLGSPVAIDAVIPLYGVDARYTFADSQTQFYIGNLIQDALLFDFTQQIGVRKGIAGNGVLSFGYVFSLSPIKTWRDPYSSGNKKKADMHTDGVRFSWDEIMDSPLNISYTLRNYEIKDEHSAQDISLARDDSAYLNRNGESHNFTLSYNYTMGSRHIIIPELSFFKADLEGRAMSYDKYGMQLSYAYNKKDWSFTTTLSGAKLQYDASNPIFMKRADTEQIALRTNLFLHNFFGVNNLSGFVSSSYVKFNSEISFYDASSESLNAGVIYNF